MDNKGTESSRPGSGGFVPPSPQELDAILDQYQFLELLGRGGMGAVYKARQKSLDRLVAIKILPAHLTQGDGSGDFHFAERFQREARAMARLSHPHIVSVYDFGQSRDGQFYFVMEYVEGTDLHVLIRTGQLTPAHVAGWMGQICEALQYAHAKGIVHRDIKPANIMITRDSQVKVADFGLAKLGGAEETKLTMTNMAMGTPDYVAPEALEDGLEVDHRADLYALGVMLYEMLTGKVPRGNWKPPSALVAGLDPRYDELVAKAIEADREERIQQASEIGATLYRIATTKPAAALERRAEGAGEGTRSPQRKEESVPAKAASAGKITALWIGGLVTGCVAVGLGGWFWLKPKLFPALAPPVAVAAIVEPSEPPKAVPIPVSEPPSSAPELVKAEMAKAVPVKSEAPETAPSEDLALLPALPDKLDTAPWSDAIDLLAWIDPAQDEIAPGWQRDGGEWFTEKRASAMVKLPVTAPEEYDLRLEITRTQPGQSISLVLTRQEREFFWVGGAYGDNTFAFGGFRGSHLPAHSHGEARVIVESCFEVGRRYTIHVSVRKSGAAAYIDGRRVNRLPADLGEMRLPDEHPLVGTGVLGLSTYDASFRVHGFQLREITGKAQFLRPAPAPAPVPAPAPTMTRTTPEAPKPAPPTPTPAPAPTDPVSLRLAELERTYQDAYAAQVSPKHESALAALNASYTGRLERDIAAASQAGQLDLALALRDELNQVKAHGAVPEEDLPELSEALKPLRATYRTTLKSLLAQRDQLAAPLFVSYDRALAAYQDELTRAQQLDEAARLKAVREQVAARRESPKPPAATDAPVASGKPPVGQSAKPIANLPPVPAVPPLPASQVLPPLAKTSPEDIASLVNWVLNDRKGRIDLAEGALRRTIQQGDALPRGNLKVVGIYIYEFPNDEPSLKQLALIGGLPDLDDLGIARHPGVFPIEALRGLTKLKRLSIGLGRFDDSGFAHLSGLQALEEISFVSIQGFTGTGLLYLGDGLTTLNLGASRSVSAEGLVGLSRYRKLRTLKLYGNPNLRDEWLRPLAALAELETLQLDDSPLDGSFLAYLPDNGKLKSLIVDATPNFKPEHVGQCGRLNNLEDVELPPIPIPREGWEALAGLPKLEQIRAHPPFTGESLAGVKGFRALTTLDVLYDCLISDAGWAAIAGAMPELESISLTRPADSKGPISAAAHGEHLGRLKKLTMLQVGGPGFTDEWMPAIGRLKSLKTLYVSGSSLTDAGLVHLQDLPITSLRFNGTKVTDASIPVLKKFPNLYYNIYYPDTMSAAGIDEMKGFFKQREK